jgi:uncharacterized surface protein with fasciclin (FAS1) repeats
MKKLIATALSFVALSATPALAGYSQSSAWDVINANTSTAKQLVLIGGVADELDACGNGEQFYTVFMPIDPSLDLWLDDNDTSVAELSATPSAVTAVLASHIARGAVGPEQLENQSVTTLVALSGFRLTKTVTDQIDPQVEEGEVYVAGLQVVSYDLVCNGVVYWVTGVIDTKPQVPTTGTNTATTTAPVESSGLPDTL